MQLSGLIGVAIFGAALLATLVLGMVRVFVVRWCPACDGAGVLRVSSRLAHVCDVCHGSGRLRVPDRPPKEWFGGT